MFYAEGMVMQRSWGRRAWKGFGLSRAVLLEGSVLTAIISTMCCWEEVGVAGRYIPQPSSKSLPLHHFSRDIWAHQPTSMLGLLPCIAHSLPQLVFAFDPPNCCEVR